jgi:hypothetical protein
MRRAQEMATLTPEIAASCIYALPRKENGGRRTSKGRPRGSRRSARPPGATCARKGRCSATTTSSSPPAAPRGTSRTNVAIAYEVKRRITTSQRRDVRRRHDRRHRQRGRVDRAAQRHLQGDADAVLEADLQLECRKVVAGDARTFSVRRDNMLHEFAVMGVTEERLCAGDRGEGQADITLDHMATLAGFFTALKDGDTTIEEAFPESGGLGAPQPAQRKSQQPAAADRIDRPPRNGGPSAAAGRALARRCRPVTGCRYGASSRAERRHGRVDIVAKGKGADREAVDRVPGRHRGRELIRGLEMAKASGVRVELVTKAAERSEVRADRHHGDPADRRRGVTSRPPSPRRSHVRRGAT